MTKWIELIFGQVLPLPAYINIGDLWFPTYNGGISHIVSRLHLRFGFCWPLCEFI